jgi:tetratricopeptide (TPR) repeat protein/glycosyltransferase involved in cell wall biosynthesis
MTGSATDLFEIAMHHHRTGALPEAEQGYRAVLAQNPTDGEALRLLGAIAHQRGEFDEAIAIYQQALTAAPQSVETWYQLGQALHQQSKLEEAIATYERALGFTRRADIYVSLGNAHRQRGAIEEAIAAYQQALHLDPHWVDGYWRLGLVLEDSQRYDEAITQYQAAIALEPERATFHQNLAAVLHKLERLEEAIPHYEQAIALQPDYAKAHLNLGTAHYQQHNWEQAIAHYQQAIALQPDLTLAYDGLGTVLLNQHRVEEAIAAYRGAIAADGNYAEGHFNLALALLLTGNFAEGFAEYEWRWRSRQGPPPQPMQNPRWDGAPLQGQSILLYAEQGFGDAMQFVRYTSWVVQQGGRVTLGCPEPLVRLFGAIPGVERATCEIQQTDFHLQAPLMSLPYILGTTLETIPNLVPYLAVPGDAAFSSRYQALKEAIAHHPQGATARLKVGLVWAGSDHNRGNHERSCRLAEFLPLFSIPNLAWYSLQKGAAEVELQEHPDLPVVNLAPHLQDFADTAVAIAELDLIISVDTAVVHLAGGLGKAVWVVLGYNPDWRWMLDREESPWYPTARLFRQSMLGDWNGVMQRIMSALTDWEFPNFQNMGEEECLQAAIAYHQAGIYSEAERRYRSILVTDAQHGEVLRLLGGLCLQMGRFEEGIRISLQALEHQPENAELHSNLAIALQNHGELEAALHHATQAAELEPTAVHHFRVANVLADQGRIPEAIAQYYQSLQRNPNDADTHHHLANVLAAQGETETAIEHYQRAIALAPEAAAAYGNLGNVLVALGRIGEGITYHQQAVERRPDSASALSNLGVAFMAQNRVEEAIAVYRRAIALDPHFPEAHDNLGSALLQLGDLAAGFTERQWRWQCQEFQRRHANHAVAKAPQWDGSNPAGKTLLLYWEQGFGDTIQFVRYAPLVKAQGAQVVLQCQVALKRLFQTVAGVDILVSQGDVRPTFDAAVSLMSLPQVLGTTLETVPAAVPYLSVLAEGVPQLEKFSEFSRHVGLVWAANAENPTHQRRSCSPRDLEPLLQQEDVGFYSLQKEVTESDAAWLQAHPHRVKDGRSLLGDFADTAALIADLDLVITVDTAVAHLAGALGKPVWVLLPYAADWRWMRYRDDSPWYPTMRLFRQSEAGDWASVVEQVTAALRQGDLLSTQDADPVIPLTVSTADLPVMPPTHVDERINALIQQAFVHHQQGEFEQAEACYTSILAQNPNHMDALQLLGTLRCQQEQYAEGVSFLRRAIAVQPSFAEGHYNLAAALQNLEKSDEAIFHYQRAIALRHNYPEAHFNLGNIYKLQEQYEQARRQYQQAIALRENYPKAWRSLGSVYQAEGDYREAIRHYQQALAIDPDYADAHSSWAYSLLELGQFEEAMQHYERAIAIDPDHVDAQFGRAAIQLRMGNYREGFKNYEWRWKYDYCPPRDFPRPIWDGSDLTGKVILLHDEQGFGDGIQAIRFAAMVKDRGGWVMVECRDVLQRIFRTVEGIDQIVVRGEPIPDFHCHVPLMSLPRVLDITLDNLPQPPYLFLPQDMDIPALPPAKSTAMLKIGVVWSANPANKTGRKRTCTLEKLRPLFTQAAIQAYSLQKDLTAEERLHLQTWGVPILADQITDFADTAAFIRQLDLVITVDTAVAHLSGALGRPTWVLLPFMSDWRWLTDRDDSPWYPSVRLFRQPQSNDWDAVIRQVGQALQVLVPAVNLNADAPSQASSPAPILDWMRQAGSCYQAGQRSEAASLCQQIIRHDPNHAGAWHLLGVIAHEEEDWDRAIAHYRKTLELSPNYPEAHGNLAAVLKQQGDVDGAAEHYQRAIALKPEYPVALCNYGNILQEKKDYEGAIRLYQQALAVRPHYAKALNNLGNALVKTQHIDEAIAIYQQAIELEPNYAEAYSNLANAVSEYRDPQEGVQFHKKALALQPDSAQARHNYSIALLRLGEFAEGWREYEQRWLLPHFYEKNARPYINQPQWDGGELHGRTVLVWTEQGFGDCIQFIRYLPMIRERGGQVLLECSEPLVALFQTMPGLIAVTANASNRNFDVQIPMMSLPTVLDARMDTIPASVPYLSVPSDRTLSLPVPADTRLKIGVVWAAKLSHPTHQVRSARVTEFLRLLELPGVTLYSLQKDIPPIDYESLHPAPDRWIDLTPQLRDFADTAAAIAQMDLMISVDTAVVHLAGALGKPTWLLLSTPADWRWFLRREDSPWYPTLRLFRQTVPDDWASVFEKVQATLQQEFHLAPHAVSPAASAPYPAQKTLNKKSKKSKKSRATKSPVVDPGAKTKGFSSDTPSVSPVSSLQGSSSSALVNAQLKQAAELHRAGQLDAAETIYHTILDRHPQEANAIHLLGVIAYQRGDTDAAIALYRKALALKPDYAEIHNNLAVALDKDESPHEAIAHYQQAIRLRPTYAEAWQNLGTVYQGIGDLDEAIRHYRQALNIRPGYADALNSLGSALRRQDLLQESLEAYNQALASDPNHLEALCGRAAVLLQLGDLKTGFVEYEWRWKHADCPPRNLSQPVWDGSDFHGKTLLLYAEQGLGDTVQFIRYLDIVRQRGDRILLELNQPGLERLFAPLAGIHQLLRIGQPLPPYDLQASLLSLPRILGTTLDTIPTQIPYLHVPPGVQTVLPAAPSGDRTVGLVWTANLLSKTGQERSCPMTVLEPLLHTPNITFYSLQKEVTTADQAILDRHPNVHRLGHQFTDLADTAGAIAQLDLVITVDTVIAHLAGALGKPVWVLLPFAPDWRWLSQRTDSPWYPATMRLFRPARPNDWQGIVDQLRQALTGVSSSSPVADSTSPVASAATPPLVTPTPKPRQFLGIGWPMSLMTGWGNFGMNLVLQLQTMPDFAPMLLVPSENTDQLNPFHRELLQPILAEQQRFQALLNQNAGKQIALNIPVLHALGNQLQGGLTQIKGDRNIGVIFLEDTYLPEAALDRGRQYTLIAAGSKWNEEVLRSYGLNHAYATPQGIDPTKFHPAPKSNLMGDRFIIFSGGKLEFRKGQDIVVGAFRQFVARHPDAILMTAWHNFWPQFMVGVDLMGHVRGVPQLDERKRLRVKEWLVANGIPAENCLDIGPIPNHLMGQVIREADVALFPNRGEGGTNLAAMECLACGIPTILSANTGHLDLIDDAHCYPLRNQKAVRSNGQFAGVEGWGESDVEEIVDRLERVYTQRQEAQQKGAAAAVFMQDWTWEKQVRRLCDVLIQTGLV